MLTKVHITTYAQLTPKLHIVQNVILTVLASYEIWACYLDKYLLEILDHTRKFQLRNYKYHGLSNHQAQNILFL